MVIMMMIIVIMISIIHAQIDDFEFEHAQEHEGQCPEIVKSLGQKGVAFFPQKLIGNWKLLYDSKERT